MLLSHVRSEANWCLWQKLELLFKKQVSGSWFLGHTSIYNSAATHIPLPTPRESFNATCKFMDSYKQKVNPRHERTKIQSSQWNYRHLISKWIYFSVSSIREVGKRVLNRTGLCLNMNSNGNLILFAWSSSMFWVFHKQTFMILISSKTACQEL